MDAFNMSDNIMEHDLLLGGGWQGGKRHRSYFDDDNPLVPCFISVERIPVS
jgi:hypothetical protein